MKIIIAVIPTIVIPICILYVLLNIKRQDIFSVIFNGALILLGLVCEGKTIYSLMNEGIVIVIISILAFISLNVMCILDYLDIIRKPKNHIDSSTIEKTLEEEAKYIVSIIDDFNSGHYYLAEISSKRVHLKIEKEDDIWKLTYKNYITGDEICCYENKTNSKGEK